MNRVKVLSQQVQQASVASTEGAYLEPQPFPHPEPGGPPVVKDDSELYSVVSATEGSGQVATALLDKGYVIVEDLIDAAGLDAINKEFHEAGFLFAGEKNSFAGYDTYRNAACILGMSKTAQQLATHPVIVNAVKEVLLPYCKRIKLGTMSRICKFPKRTVDGKAVPPQPLHRDELLFAGSSWPYVPGFKPEFVVSVMFAATDFTKENGATFVVPGSHKWQPDPTGKRPGDEIRPGSLPVEDKQIISAEMKAGSAVIWLGSTLHGAGQHNGEEKSGVRDGLLFVYYLGWLTNEQNWHFAIPLDVQKGFSEDLKDLLGHKDDGTKVDHPWVTGPLYTLPYAGDPESLDEISGKDSASRESNSQKAKSNGY